MTQGIQHRTRTYEFSPAYLARITPKARPQARKRSGGWLVDALRRLIRAVVHPRPDEVPGSLLEDVGLGARATSPELRAEFNRLDAHLHARFY
ncbi:MAG: hypothetical protein IT193_16020 [Propionibacteriaceae bacterium]|nr:hypothetical protein [Propionibacteriaceae bacterium]